MYRAEPMLVDLSVTPDGVVLGRLEGEPSAKVFIGAEADLRANLRRLGMAAGLNGAEWAELAERVWGRLGVVLGTMMDRPGEG